MSDTAKRKKVIIMGAAGRDFHNFNVLYRDNPAIDVVAFTAAQTGIRPLWECHEDRTYRQEQADKCDQR